MFADTPVPDLEPFRIELPQGPFALPAPGVPEGVGAIVYEGSGLAGGNLRRVSCRRSPGSLLVEVEGASPVSIRDDGGAITRVPDRTTEASALDVEVLLGPALVLALALEDVFCVHASSVRFGSTAAAFLGPSGSGKSTLARLARATPGRERLTDDVLPVAIAGRKVVALPRFPQLKLAPDEMRGVDLPRRIELGAIYDIDSLGPAADGRGATIRPLGLREATLRLVRFTVAARLFDRGLTERHLEFCERVSALIPVRRLDYRREPGALPAVFEAVENDLASLEG